MRKATLVVELLNSFFLSLWKANEGCIASTWAITILGMKMAKAAMILHPRGTKGAGM
jgi:hypothetical protein